MFTECKEPLNLKLLKDIMASSQIDECNPSTVYLALHRKMLN